MDYRDERDALRGRVDSLEDQLAATKQELAAAQAPPTPPSAPSPPSRSALQRLGFFGVVFGAFWPFVFTPLMVTALGPLMVPSMARLAAPIVCPTDYVRSTVETWTSLSSDGDNSEHWELRCVDTAGVAHPAPDVPTWGTLFAMTEASVICGLGVVFGIMAVGGGMRRRRAVAQSAART
jgi:hypothetical protein